MDRTEWSQFRAWYLEGSTLYQRMQREPPQVSSEWLELRDLFRAQGFAALPDTLEEALGEQALDLEALEERETP